jgi:biopolymer transport protein ExbD
MSVDLDRSASGILAELNVVPLIDILLVLLIIFMVIQPHEKKTGLGVAIPQPAAITESHPELVLVQVLGDGSLRINEQLVSWGDLGQRLKDIFALRTEHVAFIRGDSGLQFEAVARVIDLMHGAGLSAVGLLTPELEKG